MSLQHITVRLCLVLLLAGWGCALWAAPVPRDAAMAAAAQPASSALKKELPSAGVRVAGDLALAGLILIPFDADMMSKIKRQDNTAVSVVNSLGTPEVLLPVIGAIYVSGKPYEKDTAKLAVVALVDATVLTETGKLLTGRARPGIATSPAGEFTGPKLKSGYDSFPSGHTSAAFSVATVLGHRYPKYRWLYYTLAGAVGVARVLHNDHFPSDVLVGAGVGILSGESALHTNGRLLAITW